ncbi:TetR/AcrR family transcriptional regulator [Conexibacter sp. SYSU D00693]|uniref:TetR/AcrR family transcriptional regulator n=1 Tax=Conexibacter sp. SYSU D00693 TaxID=2812560 RepID=UPI00196A89A2|nr:TetR/AcrR family transcriptional regulator [Conexibacter sp. SYSU D00693]
MAARLRVRERSFTRGQRSGPRVPCPPIAAARDRKILAAAQRLFFERGFHAVAIDEIGTKAGITGPAIYRHFKGKDEILGTLFDEALDALLARVGREFDDDEPLAELEFLAQAHASFVVEHRELSTILVRDDSSLAPEYRRRHSRRERPYIARWIDCVRRAYPERSEQEATTAVFAALTLLNAVGMWPASARKAEDLAGLLAQLALGALAALAERPAARAGH